MSDIAKLAKQINRERELELFIRRASRELFPVADATHQQLAIVIGGPSAEPVPSIPITRGAS